MSTIGLVLLAAGASTRLGTPKQLLRYQEQTLLRRAAETALASRCQPVVVVLGAYAERLQPELQGLPVHSIENSDWEQGMGSSLRAGLTELLSATEAPLEAAVFMLCDQPRVSAETLDMLVDRHYETGRPLVASEYGNALGVPALFHHSLFPELLALQGAEGAKQILQRHREQAFGIPFPEGLLDIDTPDDYTRLNAS